MNLIMLLLLSIKDDKISLTDIKNNQEKFKSYLREIKKKETIKENRKSKKALCIILKRFIKEEMKLLNFMMIIL